MAKKPAKPKLNPCSSEKLGAASPERLWCQKCDLFRHCKTPFLKPFVPIGWTGKLLLIGEAPGEHEDSESKRPFTGPAGKLLFRMLRAAGYSEVDVALVNAARCRPRANATPSMQQVRACRPFLLRAIEILKPKLIVGLGGTALRALTNNGENNVTRARGKRIVVPGLGGGTSAVSGHVSSVSGGGSGGDGSTVQAHVQEGVVHPSGESVGLEVRTDVTSDGSGYAPDAVYVTYHPAAILHGATALEQRIVDDLKRVSLGSLEHPAPGLPSSALVGVDTEWNRGGVVLTVALADEKYAYVTEDEDWPDVKETLQLATSIVAHGTAQEVEQLARLGLPVQESWITGEKAYDSLLLARMVDENNLKGGYELQSLLLSFANTEPWKPESELLLRAMSPEVRDFGALPSEVRKRRCALDAWASVIIARHFERDLRTKRTLVSLTHRVASTLSRLTLAGAIVDMDAFGAMGTDLEAELFRTRDLLNKQAYAAGMESFQPTNDGHIRTLLFEKLDLPVLERTKTDKLPAVSKEVLGQLNHDVVKLLLEHNKADKLYGVNVAGLRDLLVGRWNLNGPCSFLPFHFNPLGAKTGRRSAERPNSQNWPKSVRAILRSRWAKGLIGDFDYSRLEMVLIAWAAKDEKLLHDFTIGKGYLDAAKRILGVEVQEETDLYRGIKSIILGVDYNMQTPKMAWQLWIRGIRFSADYDAHVAETDRLRNLYLSTYSGVGRYMAQRKAELLRTGQVVSASGRVRHLPVPDGDRTKGFGRLLNQAINFPIQSLASDVTGSALVDIERELLQLHGLTYSAYLEALLEWNRRILLTKESNGGIIDTVPEFPIPMTVPFNEVHDDLVFDLHPDHAKRDTELIIETMRSVTTLRNLVPSFDAPLNVGTKVGPRWGVKAS